MAEHTTRVVARYFPDGRIEEQPELLTLKGLQDAVGGYIQLVACVLPGRTLIVNEDGINLDLPYNPLASRLVSPGVLMYGYLRGVVLLVAA